MRHWLPSASPVLGFATRENMTDWIFNGRTTIYVPFKRPVALILLSLDSYAILVYTRIAPSFSTLWCWEVICDGLSNPQKLLGGLFMDVTWHQREFSISTKEGATKRETDVIVDRRSTSINSSAQCRLHDQYAELFHHILLENWSWQKGRYLLGKMEKRIVIQRDTQRCIFLASYDWPLPVAKWCSRRKYAR
jgi:hypothetical protein